MPVYILLSTLTVQGVQTLKSNPDRLRAVNQDVEELGCKVLHQWATLGEFDFINVVEAPDKATIARVSVSLGARGSTKIQTLPALPIDEFLTSIESLASRQRQRDVRGELGVRRDQRAVRGERAPAAALVQEREDERRDRLARDAAPRELPYRLLDERLDVEALVGWAREEQTATAELPVCARDRGRFLRGFDPRRDRRPAPAA